MHRKLVLIKHAMPILDAAKPASEWRLGPQGEAQAQTLADRVAAYLPAMLACSREPKARRTAEIIGARIGVPVRPFAGLEEIDRAVLPVVGTDEHRDLNRPIFEDRSRAVLGEESADEALARFRGAVADLIAESGGEGNIVVITHGTVMALFGGEHSPVHPWRLWQRLQCGDSLVFDLPSLRLVGASGPEEICAQYEHHAAAWDEHRPKVLFERGWLQRFADQLPPGGAVLDLGCGSGEPIARWFVEQGFRVCGVDSSPRMIATCRERFPDHEWQVADMRSLALGSRFDGIIAWDSFFHLTRDAQRAMFPLFAAHAARGAALMFTSGAEDGEVIGVLEGEPLYHASLAPEAYRSLLAGNGFGVVSYIEDDAGCEGHTVWLARRTGEQ